MSKTISLTSRPPQKRDADVWVETANTPDEDRPRVKPKRLTIDVHPDLHRKLKFHCVRFDEHISDFLRDLIENALEKSAPSNQDSDEDFIAAE